METDPKSVHYIFDWDDTLFPRDWIEQAKNCKTTQKSVLLFFDSLFDCLDYSLVKIFQHCLLHGTLSIVTNGTKEWIETCLEPLPKFNSFCKRHIARIHFFYRDTRYNEMPDTVARDLLLHKIDRFKQAVAFRNTKEYCLISIGDDFYEHFATERTFKEEKECLLAASIFYLKRPVIEEKIGIEVPYSLREFCSRLHETYKYLSNGNLFKLIDNMNGGENKYKEEKMQACITIWSPVI